MPDPVQREITVRNYVVGLFDILNQRQELARLSHFASASDEELGTALRATVGRVRHIRKTFRDFVEAFCTVDEHTLRSAAFSGPGNADRFLRLMNAKIGCQTFSDTTVLFAPAHVADGVAPLKEIYGMICGAAIGMQIALATKIAVRGGIEVGAGCEMEAGEVYGPVLASAYHLEQKVANYTRIVIGPTLLGLLRNFAANEAGGDHAITPTTAKLCLELLLQDDDGNYMVDIFSPKLAELTPTEDAPMLFRNALMFAGEERTRFERCQHAADNRCKCPQLAKGYERLQRYLLSRARYWK